MIDRVKGRKKEREQKNREIASHLKKNNMFNYHNCIKPIIKTGRIDLISGH